jgi:hypothetical protein
MLGAQSVAASWIGHPAPDIGFFGQSFDTSPVCAQDMIEPNTSALLSDLVSRYVRTASSGSRRITPTAMNAGTQRALVIYFVAAFVT